MKASEAFDESQPLPASALGALEYLDAKDAALMRCAIERDRYKQALEEIAREDYRGNRPWSVTRAHAALSEPSA